MTVINTSPAIHLHAVLPGGLGSLAKLIGEVIVPWEVSQELAAGHAKDATWQEILSSCKHPSSTTSTPAASHLTAFSCITHLDNSICLSSHQSASGLVSLEQSQRYCRSEDRPQFRYSWPAHSGLDGRDNCDVHDLEGTNGLPTSL